MSEYQYVHFMALDRALDEKQLAYMSTQSSRAEITKWEFTNEYHFGDFHGDAMEMLRRGYDVHLHYANFGIRRLLFRLPSGLPWDQKTWEAYLPEYGMTWLPDKKGPAGTLKLQPEADAGTFESDLFDIEEILNEIAPIRDLLMAGDLRPLYVMWLTMTALGGNDEAIEPPLPAGMDSLPDCVLALADFYDLNADLLKASLEGSPPLPKTAKADSAVAKWLDRQSKENLKRLTHRFLEEDPVGTRVETLALIRSESPKMPWPTVKLNRTFSELCKNAKAVESRRLELKAIANQKARTARLKKLAADPKAAFAQIEMLVNQRTNSSYIEAAKTLIEVGEALGLDGPARIQAEALRLSKSYPTLRNFIAELRQHGLLNKKK